MIRRALKDSSKIEGPAGESDCIALLTMQQSYGSEGAHVERVRHFKSSEIDMKEEFRNCNICTIPCSHCRHSKKMASPMGKNADEFSHDCKRKDVCQGSFDSVDVLSKSMCCACNGGHHTSSERSNLLSACSSRDSFSENVESKETLRASATSEDTDGEVPENHGSVKALIFHADKILSNRLRQQKESECFGDNISSISGSDNTNLMACQRGNAEGKCASCSLALQNNFHVAETPVGDQPALCSVPTSRLCEVEDNHARTDKFTYESSQTIDICSNKSDLSEISSLRASFSGTSLFKGEPSGCCEEQVESSLIRAASCGFGHQINDVRNNAELLKPDAKLSDRILQAEVVKCPIQKEDIGTSSAGVDESDVVKHPLESQPVDYDKVSNPAEIELRVCDICGDSGREDLLAICGTCSDGAEHIYCMREKLEKIPEGDWMCEECTLNKGKERNVKHKVEKEAVRGSIQPSSNTATQNFRNSSVLDHNSSLKLSNNSSVIKKSRSKVKSSPCFSSKRSSGNSEAMSVTKRTVVKMVEQERASRPSSKTCPNSSFNKEKSKQTLEVTAHGDCFSKYTFRTGNKSHEAQPEYQKSYGILSKSKSFKIMDSKVRGDQLEIGVKQNFVGETATSKNKEMRVARMRKSISFNNTSLDHRNALNPKVVLCCSGFSHGQNMKILKHAKEQRSNETECTSRFQNPVSSSPVPASGVSASISSEKIANCGETIILPTDGSNSQDLVDVQPHVKLNNLSNSASFSNKDFPNEEKNGVFNDVGQCILHSADKALAMEGNNFIATIDSNKSPSAKVLLPWFASGNSVVPQLSYVWKGQFDIQGGGSLPSSCGEIQAHISTCASAKVHEVVCKLPQKILLEKVPRSNNWPTQFLENSITEDKIALYFFASDVDSYIGNYKTLLDCLIKNDSSLKGKFDGVELLIFPSNLLPEKSQRWNNLLFLWGVYRGRRVNYSSESPIVRNNICIFSRNGRQNQKQESCDFPVSATQNICSCAESSKSLSASVTSSREQQGPKSFALLGQLSPERKAETTGSKISYTGHKDINSQTSLACQRTSINYAKNHLSRDAPHIVSFEREKDYKRRQVVDLNLQAGRELNIHSMRINEGLKYKRLKTCFEEAAEVGSDSRDIKFSDETTSTKVNGFSPSFDIVNLELSLGVANTGVAEEKSRQPKAMRNIDIKDEKSECSVPLGLSLGFTECNDVNTSLCL
ncbi:uncharacterized protein LOC123195536 isoform X5 [Mangifera indica]|uniref:uncharacterized protein LOC123195536 isoform X5 n=1 Tax=Mangifera indica TaxID=29780 RepID=UPI001CFBBD2B|nr:uncharacterized protein LOC123195536 isoform X5 [Mangifera indica]